MHALGRAVSEKQVVISRGTSAPSIVNLVLDIQGDMISTCSNDTNLYNKQLIYGIDQAATYRLAKTGLQV